MSSGGSPPRISVVVCTWNNAALLSRTLDALADQVPVDGGWECLVVDNNCTDDTAERVWSARAAGRIPGLRMVREPEQGLTTARLRGVRDTRAPWIAFVDDDCLLEPGWLAHAAEVVRVRPDLGGVGGRVSLAFEGAAPPWLVGYGYCFAEQELGPEPRDVPFLVGAGLVVSRAALEESEWVSHARLEDRVGSRLVSGGDVELVLRVAATGRPLHYTPDLRLEHVIPERRTAPRYVRRLHRGLGGSAARVDALRSSTTPEWIARSIGRVLGEGRGVLDAVRGAATGSAGRHDVRMRAGFLAGDLAATARLLLPGDGNHRRLLGLAPSPQSTAP